MPTAFDEMRDDAGVRTPYRAVHDWRAKTLVLISMDSTLRSNLTVGLPIDLLVLRSGALRVERQRRISEDDPYFRMIRERWSSALREAYQGIPRPDW